MFKLIDIYIGRQVIVASLLILLLLTILLSLFNLIDELADVGKGSYQIADVLLYLGLMFPSKLLQFFPMSVLIGGLFALGGMASHSELTVLRAAGMTSWQIAGSAIKASLLLMLVVLFVSEKVAPQTTQAAQQLKTTAVSGGEISVNEMGFWAKRENEIIQIGVLLNDRQMRHIRLFQLSSDTQLAAIVEAEYAIKEEDQWFLKNVVETHFYENRIDTIKEDSRSWFNPLEKSQIETLSSDPELLDIAGVVEYLDYLRENQLPTKNYQLVLWRKLLQPVAVIVMVFLASSFVFGPMRNISVSARIVSGIMVGFAFDIANRTFGPVSLVFDMQPFVGAILPMVLFAVIGYWLMKKNA